MNIDTGRLADLLLLRLPIELSNHQVSTIDAFRSAASMFFIALDGLCLALDEMGKFDVGQPTNMQLTSPYVLHGAWSVLENGHRCLRLMENPPGFKKIKPILPNDFDSLLRKTYALRNDSQHIDRGIVINGVFPTWGAIVWGQITSVEEDIIGKIYSFMPGSLKWTHSPPMAATFDQCRMIGSQMLFEILLHNRPDKNGRYTNSINLIELYLAILNITDNLLSSLNDFIGDKERADSELLGTELLMTLEMDNFRISDTGEVSRENLESQKTTHVRMTKR